MFECIPSTAGGSGATRPSMASLAVSLAVFGAATTPAVAQEATSPPVPQEATSPGGMQILVTPYLWLPGVYATTQTPLARAPEVNSL